MAEQRKLTRKEKFAQQQATGLKEPKVHSTQSSKLIIILGIIVGIFGFLLYANTLNHAFVLDDSNAITENHVVMEGISGIPTLLKTSYRYGYWRAEGDLYRPLSLVMFAIEWELFPGNPFPGHLINVLMYAFSGFLLFLLLTKILGGYNIIIPFIISLLFIAHPLHTEVAANIKSRDEMMSFFLIIISLLLLFRYLKTNAVPTIVAAVTCYFLAFLSKESAITILGVVPVILYFFTPVSTPRILKITGMFVIGAAAYLLLRKMVLGGVSGIDNVLLIDNFLVGAPDNLTRMATATLILGKYLLLLFFPHPLSIDYAYNQIPIVGWGNYKALLSLVAYLLLIIIVLMRFRKKELWVFGIILFLVSMTLYTNIFITIGSAFGERFLYVPSLGFCIAIGWLLAKVFKVDFHTNNYAATVSGLMKSNAGLLLLTAGVLGVYSFKTITRNSDWKDHYSIYKAGVKATPNSARLHYWYANEIMKEDAMKATNEQDKAKYLNKALDEYNTALKIYPEYADAYGQRGLAYYRKEERQKAVDDYKKAMSLNVGQAKVYNNLAVIYGEAGDFREALRVLKLSLQVEDRYPDAHKNIGSTYLALKEYDNALRSYFEALKYVPEGSDIYKAEVYSYIGQCYEAKGDKTNAQKYSDLVLKFNPALNKR